MDIFDKNRLKLLKLRASNNLKASPHFLSEHVATQTADRLFDFTKTFNAAYVSGSFFTKDIFKTHEKLDNVSFADTDYNLDIISQNEVLPLNTSQFDVALSILELHKLNDPLGILIQLKHALKSDGFMMSAFVGEENLKELSYCLEQAELDLYGGLSPRMHPMITKQQAGSLLQRADYALPVVDSEKITLSYTNITKLYSDLRDIGGTNALLTQNKKPLTKRYFEKVESLYKKNFSNENGTLTATIEIIYASGWTKSDTQQKPLKPGDGQTSLTEIL